MLYRANNTEYGLASGVFTQEHQNFKFDNLPFFPFKTKYDE